MKCECCKQDDQGNWLREPCCDNGTCDSAATDKTETVSHCIHCGGEMFKEEGIWWHHSQKEIPLGERGTMHHGI